MVILKKNINDADNDSFLELSSELKRIGGLFPNTNFMIDTKRLDTKCLNNHVESIVIEKFISKCIGELVLGKVQDSKTIELIICPKCYIEQQDLKAIEA